ncbi:hypothetical protein C4K68_22010 [Pokkaliibacter plantistimulans]|uniref:EF-hand domain-containing protein n=1 Tax=Proteobacteria bacterium 228 TaxID=2083153 RepID=A0A2S5KKQ2_9PROT|nr:EF-hand domain-containing protein [Pokkaliibacter plantistimulans]PPC75310.1 hypothetical protein C4K68_22010 [Pokkaliibacter plantistimulans]
MKALTNLKNTASNRILRTSLLVIGMMGAATAVYAASTDMSGKLGDGKVRMEEHFKQADTDGDGALSKAEVDAAIPRLAKHFDDIDANKDGKLTPDELKTYWQAHHDERMKDMQGKMQARFDERFKKADTNGDGQISKEEFEAEAAQRFAAMDKNGDGQLSREEITSQMRMHDGKHHDGKHGRMDDAERQAKLMDEFKKADTDGDGALSLAEAEKAMPRLAKHFDQLDADKDGKVTLTELQAAHKQHHQG